MQQHTDCRKILLVEDDKVTQQVHSYFLRKLGFEIDLASTGIKALQSIVDTHYFAVILDLGLPDMQGEEVLSIIRAREDSTGQPVPVIVVTAHCDSSRLTQCKAQQKADNSFRKPVRFSDFKQALEKLQRRKSKSVTEIDETDDDITSR